AFDGESALQKIDLLRPDVVTMDIEMQGMNGLTALKHIMIEKPLPVVMLSSLTQEGADITFEAFKLGAVDYIPKPSGTISLGIAEQSHEIIYKIKAAAQAKLTKIRRFSTESIKQQPPNAGSIKNVSQVCRHIIAIGVSTGGPHALINIIPFLPADLAACVMIVQHMPPIFTKNFSERLNSLSKLTVKEAESNDPIRNGAVYLAPGGLHIKVNPAGTAIVIDENPKDALHKPSVDVMMNSLADHFSGSITGVILTGMGKDGAQGISKIHNKGNMTIAESEKTSVVYGMPREAYQLGAIDFVLDNDKIAAKLIEAVRGKASISTQQIR
ncbi:chemotaxis response regulator protein-glutamate methylesterase, partial [bacterium]|nr:chemotaxis response regulator protein-glutamate methylesterase [bacterium]